MIGANTIDKRNQAGCTINVHQNDAEELSFVAFAGEPNVERNAKLNADRGQLEFVAPSIALSADTFPSSLAMVLVRREPSPAPVHMIRR
mmetsp:Transcript_60148/g.113536  ORF Transcript_60148/g.113536 Transcript_60148/m.113536 type:complete len:89 (-) Transcript_60148:264-530(-)